MGNLLSTTDLTLPHPTFSLRGQNKQTEELPLKTQFVVGTEIEPEQVHEDVSVLYGRLLSDILWDSGSSTC